MHKVEFAPDDELGEMLEFEWPEDLGLELDDFAVYKTWQRDFGQRFECPLWVAVSEPSTCTRKLIQHWDYYWLFVVLQKRPKGLHFVRDSGVREPVYGIEGWCCAVIDGAVMGYVFTDAKDAARFQMRRDYLHPYCLYPQDLECVEHCLLPYNPRDADQDRLFRKLDGMGMHNVPVYSTATGIAGHVAFFTEPDAIVAQSMLEMLHQ